MRARSVIVFFMFIFAISALSIRLMRVAEQPVALSHGGMRLTVDESGARGEMDYSFTAKPPHSMDLFLGTFSFEAEEANTAGETEP